MKRILGSGLCACGDCHFEVLNSSLFVHCCHCTYCQRQTGSAFALNAMVESSAIKLTKGDMENFEVSTASGKGQNICRCSSCKTALWSHYGAAGHAIAFVRVGTLQDTDIEPDVHIYTSSKASWVRVPENARSFEEYYNPREEWPEDAQARFKVLQAKG